MHKSPKFSLLEIESLLPIQNRDALLAWLKGKYCIAKQAVRSGYQQTVVLDIGERLVTSQELIDMIDTRHGDISPALARLLIDLMHSDRLPNDIYADHKHVNPMFYQFALQA